MTTPDMCPEVFSRSNTEARIHDLEQFTFWAEPLEKGGKRPRLVFGERNGAPRITVYTGMENPKVLWSGMGPGEFMMVLSEFERIVNSEKGFSLAVENLDRDPNSDKRDPNPAKIVRNKLWFGKDDNGICWMGFEQRGIQNIRFNIVPNAWHNFYREGGVKLTESEASIMYARGLVKMLADVYARWASRLRLPMERGQRNGGSDGSKKGGFGNGGSGGTTFDNDVQF